MFCLIGVSPLQVLTEGLVSLLQPSCKSVSLELQIQPRWLLQGHKLHHRMVVVIRQEWSYPHWLVYYIVVGEFISQHEFNPVGQIIVEEIPQTLLHPLVWCSVSMSVCGWKAVESRWSVLWWGHTRVQTGLVYWVPRSVTMLCGTPQLEMTCSTKSRANCGELIFFQHGEWITIFLSRSTITRILVYPNTIVSVKSVTKSIITPSHGRDCDSKGMLIPFLTCQGVLILWHIAQPVTYLRSRESIIGK